MTCFMLLRAAASGCILCKFIIFEPEGQVDVAIGIHKINISCDCLPVKMSYSVLAKQKDDRFYAPASYCFWLHPLQCNVEYEGQVNLAIGTNK